MAARDHLLDAPLVPHAAGGTLARHLASAPFIYGMLVPLALLDATASLYQAVCFRLWRVSRVVRSRHVTLARHDLAYLTPLQRANCAYCSYANGVLAYAVEIGARTEQYWCPIKHAVDPATPHARYADFVPYGDSDEIQARIGALRRKVQIAPVVANDG